MIRIQAYIIRLLTKDQSIHVIERLPDSIAIIGLRVITLQLGQSMHRLEIKTSPFRRAGKVGGLTHPQMQSETLSCLIEELTIYPQGEILAACAKKNAITLSFKQTMMTNSFNISMLS
jgi:dihydrolipoamide dehydrogenase